ncbi:MAG: hypothetical protein Q7J76_11160 [Candidatus Brocadiaceae bacterium]|uniref:hypothetical protein n=1 Tax=Candidatus Wunengus sp. YC61 TaxID=3367698 RepID=UPI0027263B8D|nr:hypothetical protein [Candidatus Brocadiaceae bacterium]
MKIKNLIPKVYEKSFFPNLAIEVEIIYTKYKEAITSINGWLETDDGKTLAYVNENMPDGTKENDIGASGTKFDADFKEEIYKTSTITTPLNRRVIEYIEERRTANKGDVTLTLYLKVKYIENKATISESYLIEPKKIGLEEIPVQTSKGEENANIIVYAHDPNFSNRTTSRWILSGYAGHVYLSLKEHTLSKNVQIAASDWINNYLPKFDMSNYFVVEIPRDKKEIVKAWEYVGKAEKCFRTWDTKGIYANCREAGTFLDEVVQKKLKDNIIIKKWKRAIKNFNHFSSLGLHTEEIKKESPEGEVQIKKSDAEHILIVTKALVKYAEELLQEDE